MKQTVSVIGLGYIGLPLALSLCERGFRVIGVDIHDEKVDKLREGYTEVVEDSGDIPLPVVLQKHLRDGTFIPTTRIQDAAEVSTTYIITVGIPVGPDGGLNVRPLTAAMEQLGRVVKEDDLVLIRSTVVPGMVEARLIPTLHETSGLVPGIDFRLAYAAERVAEGRAMAEFQTLDIVLGGVTDRCTAAAAAVLGRLTSGAIHITDLRTAQAVKVVENAQRDVNIALAQELALFAEDNGIDVYELIRMANTHPRVRLLEPNIGVGGFCIPNAYHYLSHALRNTTHLPLFALARETNQQTPRRIVDRLEEKLEIEGRRLERSTVAVLGLGMKDNSNDVRQSPAISLVQELLDRGAVVRAYDPLVPLQFPYQTKTLKESLYQAHGLIVAAWHDAFLSLNFIDALAVSSINNAVVDLKQRLSHVMGIKAMYGNQADRFEQNPVGQ